MHKKQLDSEFLDTLTLVLHDNAILNPFEKNPISPCRIL